MDSRKSNLFKIKKEGYLIIYGTIIFFRQFVNNFSALQLWKIYVFDIFNMVDFYRFLLYREVLKFWWYETFGWEFIHKASLSGFLPLVNLWMVDSQL